MVAVSVHCNEAPWDERLLTVLHQDFLHKAQAIPSWAWRYVFNAITCAEVDAQVIPSVEFKTCKKCAEEKRAGEFPRNKLTSDGLHSYCK